MLIKLVCSALLLALGISLSACGNTTGWRFEVGVSPVKELNNKAGLTQEVTTDSLNKGKY